MPVVESSREGAKVRGGANGEGSAGARPDPKNELSCREPIGIERVDPVPAA